MGSAASVTENSVLVFTVVVFNILPSSSKSRRLDATPERAHKIGPAVHGATYTDTTWDLLDW